MPTYKLNGNLVHFATGKNHVGLYPGADRGDVRHGAARRAGPSKYSKGAIQFPLDRPVPGDLIASIVAFRVAEQEQKAERVMTTDVRPPRRSPLRELCLAYPRAAERTSTARPNW